MLRNMSEGKMHSVRGQSNEASVVDQKSKINEVKNGTDVTSKEAKPDIIRPSLGSPNRVPRPTSGDGINSRDHNGNTPLIKAVKSRQNAKIVELLEKGALTAIADDGGRTPLHHAASEGDPTIVELLLAAGAPVNVLDNQLNSILHALLLDTPYISEGNKLAIAERLLAEGTPVNVSDSQCRTPLHMAALNNYVSLAKLLIEKKADRKLKDTEGRTAKDIAKERNYKELEKAFGISRNVRSTPTSDKDNNTRKSTEASLAKERNVQKPIKCHDAHHLSSDTDDNFRDANGWTPLILAAISGQFDKTKELLEKGAIAYIADGEGKTALHHALIERNLDIAGAFLNKTRCSEDWDNQGRSPLHYVLSETPRRAYVDNIESIQAKLLASGARVNAADLEGSTALHRAAYYGSELITKMLLDKGALIDRVDFAGQTPLQVAINTSRDTVVNMLLTFGASLDNQDNEGNTALHSSILGDDEPATLRIIEGRANINLINKLGQTPLHLAAINDRLLTAKFLIEIGADRNLTDSEGKTADDLAKSSANEELRKAFERPRVVDDKQCPGGQKKGCDAANKSPNNGSTTTADKLIANNPIGRSTTPLPIIAPISPTAQLKDDINSPDKGGYTSLIRAVLSERTSEVEKLLAKGALASVADVEGKTALHYSVTLGNLAISDMILARISGPVNIADSYGQTPLHLAAFYAHTETPAIIDSLLKQGLHVDARDRYNRTPLHIASLHYRPDAVKKLLLANASVSIADDYGRRALHLAVASFPVVEAILDSGADINARDNFGWTALHLAINERSEDSAKILVARGADINWANRRAQTPLHIAASREQAQITKLLIEKGAMLELKDYEGQTAADIAREGSYIELKKAFDASGAISRSKDENPITIQVGKDANQTAVTETITTNAKSDQERVGKGWKTKLPRSRRFLANRSVFTCALDIETATDCKQIGYESDKSIDRISTATSVGDTAMLLDLFARKLTGQQIALASTEVPLSKDAYIGQKADDIEKSLRLSLSKFSDKKES